MGVSAVFAALLLSFGIPAAAAQVKVTPANLTVLAGEDAHFTCSPSSSNWPAMVWLLNGAVVLTISRQFGVLRDHNPNATAERLTSDAGGSWKLTLSTVQRIHEGVVTCDVNGDQDIAGLFVQEKGSVNVVAGVQLVFQGQLVVFVCRAADWYPEPQLQWLLGNKEVSPSHYNVSREGEEQEEGKEGDEGGRRLITVSSNLSVTAATTVDVSCCASVSALRTPLSSSRRLTVVAEVLQEGEDCTALTAATAALAAALLLLLLCVGAALCFYRSRQTKLSRQEALRFDQWVSGPGLVAGATSGRVNLGYTGEGTTDADFRGKISVVQVPDLVTSSSQSQLSEGQTTWETRSEEPNPSVLRRITTV